MRTSLVLRTLLLGITLLGVFALPAYAQGEPEFQIQYIALEETSTSQVMKLYFSLTDGNHTPLLNPNFASVKLTLDTTTPVSYEEIKKAEDDLYLALVLDTSKSMARSADDVKRAVTEMLDQLPPNTHVSVITFNEEITTLQPFTTDYAEVAAKVQSITQFQGGTCLYDAAHLAVQNFYYEDPAARRAVVLFTDGKDETENSNSCSKHSIDEVVDIATDHTLPVPIFTVGIYPPEVNNVDTQRAIEALDYMASNTGGALYHGTPANITQLFRQVIGHINNQWVVIAPLCVTSGQHLVEMAVQLSSYAVTMQDAQTFTAQTSCYLVTPQAPASALEDLSVEIVGINYDDAQQTLSFSLLPSHPLDFPVTYDVRVLEGPFECLHLTLEQPEAQFALRDLACTPEAVVLAVQVIDEQGNMLTGAESQPIPLPRQATPTPEPLSLTIVGKKYDTETQHIVFSVEPSHTQTPISDYIVSVTDEGNYELLTFQTYSPDNISFSLDELRQMPTTGNIIIHVKARDAQGRAIAEAPPEKTPLFLQPTQTPVGVTINGVSQIRQGDQDYFALDVSVLGEEAVQSISVVVTRVESGAQYPFMFDPSPRLLIPVADFRPGTYEITVTAQSATASTLPPSTITVTYTPTVSLSVNIYADPKTRSFTLNLEGQNLEVITRYDVTIVRETGVSLTPKPLSFAADSISGNSIVSLDIYRLAQEAGVFEGEKLTIRLKALDTNGDELATADAEFIYMAPTAEVSSEATSESVSQRQETGWLKYALIFLVLAVIVALLGGWFFFGAGEDDEDEDEDEDKAPTHEQTLRKPLPADSPPTSVSIANPDLEIKSYDFTKRDRSREPLDSTMMQQSVLYIGREEAPPGAQWFRVDDSSIIQREGSYISRKHLKITYTEENLSYVIEVLGSNTEELNATLEPVRSLHRGDTIVIERDSTKWLLLGNAIYVEISRVQLTQWFPNTQSETLRLPGREDGIA